MTILPVSDSEDPQENYAATLQSLWIRYLAALDRYTAAQAEINSLYSSGTFALARANFSNTTGTRYGQMHFDQRMTATTLADVTGETLIVSTCLALPSNSAKTHESGIDDPLPDQEEPVVPSKDKSNPLRWFGVLLPPPLRQCQTDFLALTTGPVPRAVAAAAEMKDLERQVRRLRKERRKAARAH